MRATREEKLLLLFAFLDIAEALLGVLNRERLQGTGLAVLYLIEANSEIAQTDCNSVAFGDELDGVNLAGALNARLLLHVHCVIDADHISIRFKQNYLVDLFKVVDFLNLAVMRLKVNYVLRFLVEHIDLSGILSVVFDLMFDKI